MKVVRPDDNEENVLIDFQFTMELKATYQIIQEEYDNYLRDIIELAKSRGFIVK